MADDEVRSCSDVAIVELWRTHVELGPFLRHDLVLFDPLTEHPNNLIFRNLRRDALLPSLPRQHATPISSSTLSSYTITTLLTCPCSIPRA
jgi:hypothetical protein